MSVNVTQETLENLIKTDSDGETFGKSFAFSVASALSIFAAWMGARRLRSRCVTSESTNPTTGGHQREFGFMFTRGQSATHPIIITTPLPETMSPSYSVPKTPGGTKLQKTCQDNGAV